MSLVNSHENRLLLETVQAFMKAELHPHEDLVDRLGEVPLDLGRQIEKRAHEAGLYAANLPEEVGGGGLSLEAKTIMEREFGKTHPRRHVGRFLVRQDQPCAAQLGGAPHRTAAGLRRRAARALPHPMREGREARAFRADGA